MKSQSIYEAPVANWKMSNYRKMLKVWFVVTFTSLQTMVFAQESIEKSEPEWEVCREIESEIQKRDNIKKSNRDPGGFLCGYYNDNLTLTKEHIHEHCKPIHNSGLEHMITDITDQLLIKLDFSLLECGNIRSAYAFVKTDSMGSIPYIAYNPDFFERVSQKSKGWALVIILSHEISHHLNWDTHKKNVRKGRELDCDEFSGSILRKMGASREEAQAAAKILIEEGGSGTTHPSKNKRLKAIERGWDKAEKENFLFKIRRRFWRKGYPIRIQFYEMGRQSDTDT